MKITRKESREEANEKEASIWLIRGCIGHDNQGLDINHGHDNISVVVCKPAKPHRWPEVYLVLGAWLAQWYIGTDRSGPAVWIGWDSRGKKFVYLEEITQ